MGKRYLSLIPLTEALEHMKRAAPPPGRTEIVLLDRAVDRVSAEPVYSCCSVPGVNVAAMDGLAVRSGDTLQASDQSPVALPIFASVNTGQPVSPPFDAVIMIEDVWKEGERWTIRKAATPWQHVRMAGEDIRQGELVIPRGYCIRALDIGALASYGIAFIRVLSARVGIISAGGELVPLGVTPLPHQAIESNNHVAEAHLTRMGATCQRYPLIGDDREAILQALRWAVQENDLVLLSAGSSAGNTDYTEEIIASCGSLVFHGAGIKPGKPVMMGIVEGVPVLGIPGYPVAAQTVVREFAARLLEHWGLAPLPAHRVTARLSRNLASELGYDEFVPLSVGRVGRTHWAVPQSRGFGVQSALVRSNGYLHIPADVEGIEARDKVEVTLYEDPLSLENTVFMVGAKDIPLDLLGDILAGQGFRIRCSHEGDLGGLLALRTGSCHAAPVHLPIIGDDIALDLFRLINGASLSRAIISVQPLGLASREALSLDDLETARILNTPPGTAARAVLDHLLAMRDIQPSDMQGYSSEVKNPEAVASRIAASIADAAICSERSASASGLCFIPLARESYDLVIPTPLMEEAGVRAVLSCLKGDHLRKLLQDCGYNVSRTGQVSTVL